MDTIPRPYKQSTTYHRIKRQYTKFVARTGGTTGTGAEPSDVELDELCFSIKQKQIELSSWLAHIKPGDNPNNVTFDSMRKQVKLMYANIAYMIQKIKPIMIGIEIRQSHQW